MASTIFLKSPKRIMVLMMVMTLCLMVYAALEYRIRETLRKQAATFPYQQGKETVCQTARWVFQYFSGIHILVITKMQHIALNLNKHHINLLKLLGVEYEKLYAGFG